MNKMIGKFLSFFIIINQWICSMLSKADCPAHHCRTILFSLFALLLLHCVLFLEEEWTVFQTSVKLSSQPKVSFCLQSLPRHWITHIVQVQGFQFHLVIFFLTPPQGNYWSSVTLHLCDLTNVLSNFTALENVPNLP